MFQPHEIPPTPLLAHVDPADWPEILAPATRMELPTATPLFQQDGPPGKIYVLLSGEVEVSIHGQGGAVVLARLGPGAVLGEIGFLIGSPRSASVYATEPCTLLEYSNEAFRALLDKRTPAAFQVLQNVACNLAERLLETDARVRQLSMLPSTESARADLLELRKLLLVNPIY